MTLVSTPFGFHSTAEEVARGVDLSGKDAIVTGGASGIGIETARALAGTGAAVTLAVRDTDAGERVAGDIRATTGNRDVRVARLDLADQASVAAFVDAWAGPLHVLVDNAGVMALPDLQRTPEGWELQFATNHLGHFALATGLHGALAAAGAARIVSVSSTAHLSSPVVFEDIQFERRPYDGRLAYAQSKTANVLFAVAAAARWAGDGILANSLTPGAIPTNLQRYTGAMKTPPERRKTPEEGAATSTLLAVSPFVEGVGGRYFEDCNEVPVVPNPSDYETGVVAEYAIDPELADRLWHESVRLLA